MRVITMMNKEQTEVRDAIVAKYEKDLDRLQRFLPYLDTKGLKDEQIFYKGEGGGFRSVPFPVYDSNLLAFIKEAEQTQFINKNYPYVYRRYQINNTADEKKIMAKADINDIDAFCAILSKYVIEGHRRGVVWTEGLQYRIYVDFIKNLNRMFYRYYYEPEKLIH